MFTYKGCNLGVTNVHLNWKSNRKRQEQMNAVNNWITNKVSDYELLCGDFNDDPYSMVHQYLIRKHWIDVAQFKEIEENMIAQPTLVYRKNPNLKGDVKQEKRYDWVMIQENAAFEFPTIENVSIFGDSVLTSTGVFPSDHYSVFVELKFNE